MILYEYEAKDLCNKLDLPMPKSSLFNINQLLLDTIEINFPVVIKAQVLKNNRSKLGLIKYASDKAELDLAINDLKLKQNQHQFESILIEEKINIKQEWYCSYSFNTQKKSIILSICRFGGMDIEMIVKRLSTSLHTISLSPRKDFFDQIEISFLQKIFLIDNNLAQKIYKILESLWNVFLKNEAILLEVNPIILSKDNQIFIADVNCILQDNIFYKANPFKQRIGYRELTKRELVARQIDQKSHKGVVGRSFIELDGDIGFLGAGGGASNVNIDTLFQIGLKPANFVEISGNPLREDVKELTKLILTIPNIKALWVVGGTANFTDIYESISGIIDASFELNSEIPIIIRRDGPNANKAKQLIAHIKEQSDKQIYFFDETISMYESALFLKELLQELES